MQTMDPARLAALLDPIWEHRSKAPPFGDQTSCICKCCRRYKGPPARASVSTGRDTSAMAVGLPAIPADPGASVCQVACALLAVPLARACTPLMRMPPPGRRPQPRAAAGFMTGVGNRNAVRTRHLLAVCVPCLVVCVCLRPLPRFGGFGCVCCLWLPRVARHAPHPPMPTACGFLGHPAHLLI